MTSIRYSPKKIFDKDFKFALRGYDKQEVDAFLDEVIKDYENYAHLITRLQEENAQLKAQVKRSYAAKGHFESSRLMTEEDRLSKPSSISNYDLLKRISRLEKEVFGKQIIE